MTNGLVDRRDARQIKQLARDLVVSVETVPVGDGLLTVARLDFLLQLRDAFGDEGMADVYAVIDGPALRKLKGPAGLRSIDDELAAVRAVEARKAAALNSAPTTTLRPEAMREPSTERVASPIARAVPAASPPAPPAGLSQEREAIRDEVRAAKRALGVDAGGFAALLLVSRGAVDFWLKGRYRPTADKLALIRVLVAEKARA